MAKRRRRAFEMNESDRQQEGRRRQVYRRRTKSTKKKECAAAVSALALAVASMTVLAEAAGGTGDELPAAPAASPAGAKARRIVGPAHAPSVVLAPLFGQSVRDRLPSSVLQPSPLPDLALDPWLIVG